MTGGGKSSMSMPILRNVLSLPTSAYSGGPACPIKLKSADVIHAFWVPTLGGKTQMIPGPDKSAMDPGGCARHIYRAMRPVLRRGHAHMGFEIIAESAHDFQRWRRRPASNSFTWRPCARRYPDTNCSWIVAPAATRFRGTEATRRSCARPDSLEITAPTCGWTINQYA